MHVHYLLFDACPENGGKIVSYPSNAIGTTEFTCWEQYGGHQIDFLSYHMEMCSQVWDDTYWTEEPPSVNFAGTDYQMTVTLQPNTEYWLAIAPSGNCLSQQSSSPGAIDTYVWGCMSLEIEGLMLLNEVELSIADPSALYPELVVWPEDAIIERSYNLITWQQIGPNPDVDIASAPSDIVVYYRAHHSGSYSDLMPFYWTGIGDPDEWWLNYDNAGRRIRE